MMTQALLLFSFLLFSFLPPKEESLPYLIVLGVAQDGSYPQAGCQKACCKAAWNDPSRKRFVASLALVNPATGQWWLFDATPDFREQLELFREITAQQYSVLPTGIFLTHGHIGHYTGLMQLGREVMGTDEEPVYAMPRMKTFLTNNGPWSQLVSLHNITLNDLHADSVIHLAASIEVTPFLVPHRDEYTETVGFRISVNGYAAIFIPDIDKWKRWSRNINEVIQQSNLVFVDGTFYKNGELGNRSMDSIPHPFVAESMQRMAGLSATDKMKVHFIHFNHTNPLLDEQSTAYREVIAAGFNVAEQGKSYPLHQ